MSTEKGEGTGDKEFGLAAAQELGLVRARVAAQDGVWVDVVGIVGAARHMVRRHQHVVKVLHEVEGFINGRRWSCLCLWWE